MGQVELHQVCDVDTVAEICRFRVQVWRATGALAEAAFELGEWRDEADQTATHWVARDITGQIVGAARLQIYDRLEQVPEYDEYLRYGLEIDGRIAAPDRVVVSAAATGQGVGGALVDIQEETWLATDAKAAVRQASPAMSRLITKRGWELLGPATRLNMTPRP